MKEIKKMTLLLAGLSFASLLSAQRVIFPQQQQPGTARIATADNVWTVGNDLLSARFERHDNQLHFAGSPEFNLLPTDELFRIKLGNGTSISSKDMTLGNVRVTNLAAEPTKARGVMQYEGKQLEADYTYGNLSLVWRAILRNGSHYLRTELSLTANADQSMASITPMIHTVDNIAAGSAPKSVGNTRGAVLLSDKIFAGLETPMGVNSVLSGTEASSFVFDSWNAAAFAWEPGNQTPQGIRSLGFTQEQVRGKKGYLTFKEAGANQITFTYQSGNNRLNLVGVDVIKDGAVVASDYHIGYTGYQKQNNTYTVNIPEAGHYLVRYFVETRSEAITSTGAIAYNKRVAAPFVVYDLPPNTEAKAAPTNTPRKILSNSTFVENVAQTDTWKTTDWQVVQNVPLRIGELGYSNPYVKSIQQDITLPVDGGTLTAEFVYQSGSNGLSIVGLDLLDANNSVVVSDYHKGFSGIRKENNTYSVRVPYAGTFKMRYLCENKTEANTSTGNITLKYAVIDTLHLPVPATSPIECVWYRPTTLKSGETWTISGVIGLVAEGQPRRSFLAYSERERAVPWRPYPVYISWYELNIDRNNDPNYTANMNVQQCTDIVKQWKTHLFDKHGLAPKAFVWDDGWDQYGTWTFNKNFPNGFFEPDSVARLQGSGIGGWLGPVGGYGKSGDYRRAYWSTRGGMQLSNPAYYKVFLDACNYMIDHYDFRFFKYDGISAQFSSVGPDASNAGIENAEGIIAIEKTIREKKDDIFFNTTVGTWASPFWFQVTDAVWRQENDYSTIGNNTSDRENWITYRDRLVYQNFVQNSPICPINTLMTHGFILSTFGNVSKDMSYKSVLNELRCAFACGSGMVELYNDYALMNSIQGGKLWDDLAECIRWQEANKDVLPDIHWVGGNPWDGSKANVYGWASWNGKKATLALRNGANYSQTFRTTLRKALDIPAYIQTSITLTPSFTQSVLSGLKTGQPINIDEELILTLPASSVFVFDGVDTNGTTAVNNLLATAHVSDEAVYDLAGRRLPALQRGVNVVNGKKVLK